MFARGPDTLIRASLSPLLFAFDVCRTLNVFDRQFTKRFLGLNVANVAGVLPTLGGLITQIDGVSGHGAAFLSVPRYCRDRWRVWPKLLRHLKIWRT